MAPTFETSRKRVPDGTVMHGRLNGVVGVSAIRDVFADCTISGGRCILTFPSKFWYVNVGRPASGQWSGQLCYWLAGATLKEAECYVETKVTIR